MDVPIDGSIERSTVLCVRFLSLSLSPYLSPHHIVFALLFTPPSFSLTLLVLRASRYHRDYTQRGKEKGEGAPRPPRALTTSVGLFAQSRLYLYL